MLKWFYQAPHITGENSVVPDATLPDNWNRPESAETLLDTPLRQQLIRLIWQRTSMPGQMFRRFYLIPIQNYASLVQLLPASQYHHHAYYGGMLDHGLEVACYAAKIRQNHLFPPGAPPEDQTAQAEAWTAAVIYAALMHDVGKLIVDMEIEKLSGKLWYPWHGTLEQPWRLRYRQGRNYRLHPAAGSLMCRQILTNDALDWMVSNQALFAPLLWCISGHYEQAGLLGEVVTKADQASVAQNLGGNPTMVLQRKECSLPKHILMALRYLLQHTLKLNNPNGGSDGWLTDEALWLVCKTTADHIRAYLLQQGITSVPDSNSRLFDEMQAHGIAIPCNDKIIWRSKITALSGWSSTLTLLRISPALIWEKQEDRPSLFDGFVELTDMDAHPDDLVKTGLKEDTIDSDNSDNSDNSEIIISNKESENEAQSSLAKKLFKPEITRSINEGNTSKIPSIINANEISLLTSIESKQDSNEKFNDGHVFFSWICDKVYNNALPINVIDAKIHMVSGNVFLVSPGIFKFYLKEVTGAEEQQDIWRTVQKNFQKLNIHRKKENGLNIWDCLVTGPRKCKKLKGYLIEEPGQIFQGNVPDDNPCLSLIKDETL
jgi:integrating conjugative element relaxase (TIGR03760 family)